MLSNTADLYSFGLNAAPLPRRTIRRMKKPGMNRFRARPAPRYIATKVMASMKKADPVQYKARVARAAGSSTGIPIVRIAPLAPDVGVRTIPEGPDVMTPSIAAAISRENKRISLENKKILGLTYGQAVLGLATLVVGIYAATR